jgi:hypothetical protein
MLYAGRYRSELRGLGNSRLITWDPPLASLILRINQNDRKRAVHLISDDPDEPGDGRFMPTRHIDESGTSMTVRKRFGQAISDIEAAHKQFIVRGVEVAA